jgi:hypothetical protein
MANVLTTGSVITCLHTGTATLTSGAKLKVGGNPVLLETQATKFLIAKCTQVGTNLTPCTKIATVKSGSVSVKLKVGGVAVLLDSLGGTTNGNPGKTFSATANQSKLVSV